MDGSTRDPAAGTVEGGAARADDDAVDDDAPDDDAVDDDAVDDDAADDDAALDPTELDPFERGAILPDVVERNPAVVLARGVVVAAWLVVRLTVTLLLLDLAIEIGRRGWDADGGLGKKLFAGTLGFLGDVTEVHWLAQRTPDVVTYLVAFVAVLAVFALVNSASRVLSAGVETVRDAGDSVGGLVAAAQADLVDRVIAGLTRPVGKWPELGARVIVGLLSGAAVAALFRAKPPQDLLDVVWVRDTFSFLPSVINYLKLGIAWLAALYLTFQAVVQLVAATRVARERRPGPMTALPPTAPAAARTLALVHWSDLHITPYEDSLTTDLVRIGGNRDLRRLVAIAATGTEPIVITGDSTDAGRSREWRALFALIAPVIDRVVLVPGNHDLNIVDPLRWVVIGDDDGRGRALRQVRMLAALARVQGARAWLVDGDEVVRLDAYVAARAPGLRRYYRRPKETHPAWVDAQYRAAFPMAVELPDGFIAMVFDSNEAAATVLSNAFGQIDDAALGRYHTLRAHFADRAQLVALHHHLAYPSYVTERRRRDRIMARFIVLRNTRQVVAALDRQPTVVLHGHKHIGHEGRLGQHLDVVSARSTTLGDGFRGDQTPGARVVTIAATEGGGTRLVGCEDWPEARPVSPIGAVGSDGA